MALNKVELKREIKEAITTFNSAETDKEIVITEFVNKMANAIEIYVISGDINVGNFKILTGTVLIGAVGQVNNPTDIPLKPEKFKLE